MSMLPSTLADIERQAAAYAEAHEALRKHVEALELAIKGAKRQALPQLMVLAAKAAGAKTALRQGLEASPALFAKPKSRIINGVKVGYQKAKGEITIEDEAKTIKLIRKNFTEAQADLLIKTTEKPLKKAISQLSAADAKKIGVEISETGDEVVIKVMTGDVEALVDAFVTELSDDPEALGQEN